MSGYNPRKIKQYKRGDTQLSAADFNDIVRRLIRLETMTGVNPVEVRHTDRSVVIGINSNGGAISMFFAMSIAEILPRSSENIVVQYDVVNKAVVPSTFYKFENQHNWYIPPDLVMTAIQQNGLKWIIAVDCP